jgi:uncharacterized membrane protein
MNKPKRDNVKELLSEKLRNHAFDIIIISMAACLFCLMVYYKKVQKDTCEIKTEKVQQTTKIINSNSQKSR